MKKKTATKPKKATKKKAVKKTAAKPLLTTKKRTTAEILGLKSVGSTQLAILENAGKKLSIAQEAFCQFITAAGNETYNNATLSHAAAYGYDFDKLSADDAVYEDDITDEEGNVITYGKKIRPSSRDLAENVCAVNGRRLLRNAQIAARIVELMNKGILKDKVVDYRMARWIMDDHEPAASTRMISEYNKLHGRVKDVIEVRGPAPLKAQKEAHKALLAKIAKKNAKAQA